MALVSNLLGSLQENSTCCIYLPTFKLNYTSYLIQYKSLVFRTPLRSLSEMFLTPVRTFSGSFIKKKSIKEDVDSNGSSSSSSSSSGCEVDDGLQENEAEGLVLLVPEGKKEVRSERSVRFGVFPKVREFWKEVKMKVAKKQNEELPMIHLEAP